MSVNRHYETHAPYTREEIDAAISEAVLAFASLADFDSFMHNRATIPIQLRGSAFGVGLDREAMKTARAALVCRGPLAVSNAPRHPVEEG